MSSWFENAPTRAVKLLTFSISLNVNCCDTSPGDSVISERKTFISFKAGPRSRLIARRSSGKYLYPETITRTRYYDTAFCKLMDFKFDSQTTIMIPRIISTLFSRWRKFIRMYKQIFNRLRYTVITEFKWAYVFFDSIYSRSSNSANSLQAR